MVRLIIIAIIVILIIIVFLSGCSSKASDEQDYDDEGDADYEIDYDADAVVVNTRSPEAGQGADDTTTSDPSNKNPGVTLVTGAEARDIFESDNSVILLDVRNQDEHDDYHIVGSILIPVDELESRLSELPDKDAVIIVFCRAGRRSAIASEILVSNGYTKVNDMQGIENW